MVGGGGELKTTAVIMSLAAVTASLATKVRCYTARGRVYNHHLGWCKRHQLLIYSLHNTHINLGHRTIRRQSSHFQSRPVHASVKGQDKLKQL